MWLSALHIDLRIFRVTYGHGSRIPASVAGGTWCVESFQGVRRFKPPLCGISPLFA